MVVAKKMTVAKRMTKEELREDKVLTSVKRLTTFVQHNLRYVIGAVALVALVVIGTSLWNQSRGRAEGNASFIINQAQQLYYAGNYPEALSRFQAVESQYGSASAARPVKLFIGNCQLTLGNPVEAEKAFRSVVGKLGGDPVLRAGALRGLGAALADQGKAAEAADSYQQAAAVQGNPLASEDWWAAGNAHTDAGNLDQAKQAYQRIIDDFPRSSHLMEARLRLAEIGAR